MSETGVVQWRPPPWFLLNPPLLQPGIINRRRIHDLLIELTRNVPITLLQAPAGFGKSTVLADWAREQAVPVAWLTASRGDDSPGQFIVSLLSALCHVADRSAALFGFRDVLVSPDDLGLTLSRMLTVCNRAAEPLVVVIDDAQLLSADVASQVLRPLAQHAITLRFVVAGNQGLDQWFNAELTTGAAARIGPDVLALTIDEIRDLMLQAYPGLNPQAAESVSVHTRGWPVAVRLALAGGIDEANGMTAAGASADDILASYISGSILDGLPFDLADFVMAATTSSRLTARLAEILTGRSDAGRLLDECVMRGLFLDRFQEPDKPTIYRWHDVFARHCRALLSRADEARAERLNRLAAEAMQSHYPAKASMHAMLAHDPQLSWRILQDNWIRMLVEGQAAVLNLRCLALPSQGHWPDVSLVRACCLSALGDEAAAAVLAAQSRRTLAERLVHDRDTRCLAAFAELFLAHDHTELASAADDVAGVLLGAGPASYLDTYAVFLLGWTELRLRRDPAKAAQLLAAARRDAQAMGATLLARRTGLNLMFALTLGGKFNDVRRLSQELDEAVAANLDDGWQHYDGGIEFVSRGFTAYWRNELSEAQRQLQALIAQGGGPTSYTALARIQYALTAAASGDARLMSEARSHLTDVSDQVSHGVAWPAYKTLAGALLLAAAGDRPRALTLCERLAKFETIPVARVLAAEVCRKAGRPQLALEILGGIGRSERVSHVNASAQVTTATIMAEQGDRLRAHRLLERALDVAAPEGIARPFVADSDDDALRQLLTEHAAWGSAHEGFLALQIAHSESGVSRTDILGTALSPREREIFGYLRTTMTAAEIAETLFVSVNTVRTHQRAIYRKLGVATRREAIKKYRM